MSQRYFRVGLPAVSSLVLLAVAWSPPRVVIENVPPGRHHTFPVNSERHALGSYSSYFIREAKEGMSSRKYSAGRVWGRGQMKHPAPSPGIIKRGGPESGIRPRQGRRLKR